MKIFDQLERAQFELIDGEPGAPQPTGRFFADITNPTAALPKFWDGTQWQTLAYPVAPQSLSLVAVTGNYNATAANDIILGSSAALNVNLPTAVGIQGKVLTIKKTDASLTNTVTLVANGSETIDGVPARILATQNQAIKIVSDGANWQVLDQEVPPLITAYTPTLVGFGTYSNVSFLSWRDRSELVISGYFTSGTSTAVEAQCPLGFMGVENNVAISASYPALSVAGYGTKSGGAATTNFTNIPILREPGATYLTFGIQSSTVSGLNKANGNVVIANTHNMSFNARVLVDNWAI